MKDEDRDRIHQYIVQNQYEIMENKNQQISMEYYDDTPEALTGD